MNKAVVWTIIILVLVALGIIAYSLLGGEEGNSQENSNPNNDVESSNNNQLNSVPSPPPLPTT